MQTLFAIYLGKNLSMISKVKHPMDSDGHHLIIQFSTYFNLQESCKICLVAIPCSQLLSPLYQKSYICCVADNYHIRTS